MMHQYVKETIIENIVILELDRPEALNALNSDLVEELLAKAKSLENNDDIKALIIMGEKNFAAGGDIKYMVNCSASEAKNFMFAGLFKQIENLKMPTIAAISGYALGGGFELALACDFRLASKNAILALPEINIGIFPGAGGSIRLPRLIGEAKAKELIYLGSRVTADEALELGILNKVVDDDKLKESAIELAQKLSTKPKLALSAAKKTINCAMGYNKIVEETEAYEWSNLFNSEDQKEGMNAFLEKRKPLYKGK